MKVWTIANQKGGVGKTTTTVALGGLLAEQGQRVLLLDLDPHASLTSYMGLDPDGLQHSLFDIFPDHFSVAEQIIQTTMFENLALMPASMSLATLDKTLGSRDGMGLVLSKLLHSLNDRFDYALLDCPPILGVLMVNALAACDRLLIPVQTEFLALKGLERMIRTLKMILHARKEKVSMTIIPTMYDKRTNASVQTLREIRLGYENNVWRGVIPVDTKFRDASKEHIPPTIYDPAGRGSEAYAWLLRELTKQEVKQESA